MCWYLQKTLRGKKSPQHGKTELSQPHELTRHRFMIIHWPWQPTDYLESVVRDSISRDWFKTEGLSNWIIESKSILKIPMCHTVKLLFWSYSGKFLSALLHLSLASKKRKLRLYSEFNPLPKSTKIIILVC